MIQPRAAVFERGLRLVILIAWTASQLSPQDQRLILILFLFIFANEVQRSPLITAIVAPTQLFPSWGKLRVEVSLRLQLPEVFAALFVAPGKASGREPATHSGKPGLLSCHYVSNASHGRRKVRVLAKIG